MMKSGKTSVGEKAGPARVLGALLPRVMVGGDERIFFLKNPGQFRGDLNLSVLNLTLEVSAQNKTWGVWWLRKHKNGRSLLT